MSHQSPLPPTVTARDYPTCGALPGHQRPELTPDAGRFLELERVYRRIVERADRLLDVGTLVTDGRQPSYAFVVPVAARDDLADAFGDLSLLEDA